MKKLSWLLPILLIACQQQKQENETTDKPATPGVMTWTAPDGWLAETPSNPMRKAQFSLSRVEGDPENGSVVITYFPGQGQVGGEEANLKRWYSQFVQPDGSPTENIATVKKMTVNNLEHTIVEVTGTYLFQSRPMASAATEKPNFKMLAAIVQSHSGPWFVKFIGPEKTVSKWQDSFYQFMETFKES